MKSQKVKEFNTQYIKSGENKWMEKQDGKNYLIEINEEKWSVLYTIEPRKIICCKVEATELLKKVRRIEIKTRGLSRHIFAGEYHSAFKGRGIAFSEVREYQYGDDIRSIDWNVTARFNHPYVKIFEEERELTVMLLIDVSGSGNFGTTGQL